MINVIEGNDADFNNIVYGVKHPGTLNFIRNQIENVNHAFHHLNEASQRFYSNVGEMFERLNGSEAMRRARMVKEKITGIFIPDDIRYLNSIEKIQQAQPYMQRFIMAEPTIRRMYHNQQVDGYSHSYIDAEPLLIGKDHIDYRFVMDGVVNTDEEGEHYYTFYDPENDIHRTLILDEQNDILNTWEMINISLEVNEYDPTSSFGDKL